MIKIREAQIIDNVDPDEKGLYQIRILPEMIDVEDDLLPWVPLYQMGNGFSSETISYNVLEIDSFVKVIIEDWPHLRQIRVISNDYIEGLFTRPDLSGISEISEQTYPQPSYTIYKDGSISFHNSETGEHGFLYANGGYFLIDENGNTYVNTLDKETKIYNDKGSINLKNDGSVEIKSQKDLTLAISSNTKIETTGNTDLKTTGNTTIDTTGNTQIKSTGTVNIQGATVTMQGTTNLVSPTGSGPFCALPACLFTGAPHVGSTLS